MNDLDKLEVKRKMVPYEINRICSKCNRGWMKLKSENGRVTVLLTYPAQYSHVCDNCGATATFFKSYPYIVYEPEVL